MENLNYKTEILKEILRNYAKERTFQDKNVLSELEIFFTELKDIELKDKKAKIKKEIEELFLNRLWCL